MPCSTFQDACCALQESAPECGGGHEEHSKPYTAEGSDRIAVTTAEVFRSLLWQAKGPPTHVIPMSNVLQAYVHATALRQHY